MDSPFVQVTDPFGFDSSGSTLRMASWRSMGSKVGPWLRARSRRTDRVRPVAAHRRARPTMGSGPHFASARHAGADRPATASRLPHVDSPLRIVGLWYRYHE